MENESEFRNFLKQMGKKPHVIDGLVKEIHHFEEWLVTNSDKLLENADNVNLKRYANQFEKREVKIYMRALALYYRWIGNNELKELAHSMREAETAKKRRVFKLCEFHGVNQDDVEKLESVGVRNVEDILSMGKIPRMRKELADRSGVALESIMELVKLSDLSRLPGVKGIRARLYLEAGVDTVEAFRHWEPEALHIHLEKFVREKGFDGIAPLPKEIESTIKYAANLENIIDLTK